MQEEKWYHSSTGSGNVSMTVKGAIVSLVPVSIALLAMSGYTVDESMVMEAVNAVFTAVSAVLIVYGIVRKVYIALTK